MSTPGGRRGDTVKFPFCDEEYYRAKRNRSRIAKEATRRQIDFGNPRYEGLVRKRQQLEEKLRRQCKFPTAGEMNERDDLRYKCDHTKEELDRLNELERDPDVRRWYMLSDYKSLLEEIQNYDCSEGSRAYYEKLQWLAAQFESAERNRCKRRWKRRARRYKQGTRTKPGPSGGYGAIAPLRF